MLKDNEDAFGHEMMDHLLGKGGYEIVERDDGLFEVSGGPKGYFSDYKDWPEHERKAMKFVRGRVLDIGCGAGRHSLYLQEKGHDVFGIDNSPLAIEVCRQRGLRDARVMAVTQVTSGLGVFDTILMMGNNFGLFGNPKRARWLVRRLRNLTSEEGRIVAETIDPYDTNVPEHLEYHNLNRKRGRMGGQTRLRIRYRKYVTPWFEYMFVSREEMEGMLDGTGWNAGQFVDSKGPFYIAVIEKE